MATATNTRHPEDAFLWRDTLDAREDTVPRRTARIHALWNIRLDEEGQLIGDASFHKQRTVQPQLIEPIVFLFGPDDQEDLLITWVVTQIEKLTNPEKREARKIVRAWKSAEHHKYNPGDVFENKNNGETKAFVVIEEKVTPKPKWVWEHHRYIVAVISPFPELEVPQYEARECDLTPSPLEGADLEDASRACQYRRLVSEYSALREQNAQRVSEFRFLLRHHTEQFLHENNGGTRVSFNLLMTQTMFEEELMNGCVQFLVKDVLMEAYPTIEEWKEFIEFGEEKLLRHIDRKVRGKRVQRMSLVPTRLRVTWNRKTCVFVISAFVDVI